MNYQLRPKNWNENAIAWLFYALLVIICLVVLWALSGCQKEVSSLKPETQVSKPVSCDFGITDEQFTEAARRFPNKGKGKPPKDTTANPEDPTNPQPETGRGVIFLDFDGHYVSGTYWDAYSGPFYVRGAGITPEAMLSVLSRVQADYAEFAVTVTTDSTLFWSAPSTKRVRVVLTQDWEWYGRAGGVAYTTSFWSGRLEPAFVFPSLLNYHLKMVSDATSHEAGHTFQLLHQSKWVDGVKVNEYNPDIAADGKGYLMGYPYDKVSGWQVGLNQSGSLQDDRARINSKL